MRPVSHKYFGRKKYSTPIVARASYLEIAWGHFNSSNRRGTSPVLGLGRKTNVEENIVDGYSTIGCILGWGIEDVSELQLVHGAVRHPRCVAIRPLTRTCCTLFPTTLVLLHAVPTTLVVLLRALPNRF